MAETRPDDQDWGTTAAVRARRDRCRQDASTYCASTALFAIAQAVPLRYVGLGVAAAPPGGSAAAPDQEGHQRDRPTAMPQGVRRHAATPRCTPFSSP